MKEESGVLEVDYRSEGSGVEVSVLFELEVSGESRATNGEVAFESLECWVAD
jgi:hypothetical protein